MAGVPDGATVASPARFVFIKGRHLLREALQKPPACVLVSIGEMHRNRGPGDWPARACNRPLD
eukprot:6426258-Lingulodinium_polyedra.AAC.1